jgi:hypothetical protein
MLRALRHLDTDDALASARANGEMSRHAHSGARRHAHKRDDDTHEGRSVAESQFPHGMHNVAVAYASSASTNVVAYEDFPVHHLLAVRNLNATTNDESYHGSASELPPATSHGYAEWDFCGVPDPVMF